MSAFALNRAGPPGQRYQGHAEAADRAQVHAALRSWSTLPEFAISALPYQQGLLLFFFLSPGLVSAQFMHLAGADLDAHAVLTRRPDMFRSAEQLAASLDPGGWEIRVASAIARSAIDMDGRPLTVRDTVLRAARRP